MINFQEELKKYKPVLEIEELEEDSVNSDIKDMIELLQQLTGSLGNKEKR